MINKTRKEKIIGATGGISGAVSVLGSWQVCHSICLGIIALLGLIGITVVGMPLLFLTKIAKPLWMLAAVLLLIVAVLYLKKKCISGKMMLFNTGVVIAGIPFESLQDVSAVFWTIGGVLVLASIWLLIQDKMAGGKKNER